MWNYTYSNELYHYGVLGMKWGRRKARSETGNSGATRKGDSFDEIQAKLKAQKAARKSAEKRLRRDAENRSALSNDDLRANTQRLEQEKRLKDLTDARASVGRKVGKKALDVIGNVTTQVATQTLTNVGTKIATGSLLYFTEKALTNKTGGIDYGRLASFAIRGGPKGN